MFPFPIATPQGCNIQTFYGSSIDAGARNAQTWNKPVGVSHVYMMLIGSGGAGGSTQGGGSGGVTVWYGAAQHVPDSLIVNPAATNEASDTTVSYRGRSLVTLLGAGSSLTTSAGAAVTATAFAASGFYKSTAGEAGSTSGVTASSTTFLSAGADASIDDVVANYGYDNTASNGDGYFQMQPIIVGVGGNGSGKGGVGCGAGRSGLGGPGMVLIASW
jgi:hypothetical protein